MTTSFALLKPKYDDRWKRMKIRPAKEHNIDHDPDVAAEVIVRNKDAYQHCESLCHGIPWWWFGPTHYREASLDFSKYLGNGQSLRMRTTIVPKNRGPFDSFWSGVADAMKLQGFIGASDWSLARSCYRWEGYNGFGYEGKCAPPYLYAGSDQYGPPEAPGGFYVGDHDFRPGAVW